jgi:hypothetical protein
MLLEQLASVESHDAPSAPPSSRRTGTPSEMSKER